MSPEIPDPEPPTPPPPPSGFWGNGRRFLAATEPDLTIDELLGGHTSYTDDDAPPARNNGSAPPPPLDLLDGLRDGAWLNRQHFDPLQFHLPGIIPEGSTLLVGPPKIGKSWLLLALTLGVARGGRVLGLVVESRPVLYLALEDSDRRLQDRCNKLLAGALIPERFEYMTRIQPNSVLATVEAWLDRHPDDQPLVVLDTLGRVMPPAVIGESTYQRDYRVGAALKRLVDDRPGSALTVAHHDRKASSDDFVDSVSGTNGLAGAADTIIVLSRTRIETGGLLKVTGRDVREAEYSMTLKDGTTWELDGRSLDAAAKLASVVRSTAGKGDRMAEVIGAVADLPSGARPRDVAGVLGLDVKTVDVYLGRAVKTGALQRLKRGVYSLPGAPSTPVGSVGSVGFESLGWSEPNTTNTSNTPTAAACVVCGGPADHPATTHAPQLEALDLTTDGGQ